MAADDTSAMAVSWAKLAGLPSCYAGPHALRCSETRNSFLQDALYSLRITPGNYQLQRLLAVHQHDPTAGDEVVELLLADLHRKVSIEGSRGV